MAMEHGPGLVIVFGATGTGKSEVALALAERWGVPLLNADSRQIYRRFDIGTAKPTPAERQRVPHFLWDIAEPTENFTLAQYQECAQAQIAACHAQGQTPILVGGTGLYVRAVMRGLRIPAVPPQPELRSQLLGLGQSLGYAWLQQVDPGAAAKIHPNDAVRTLRALEVFYSTGRPLSAWQGEAPPTYPIWAFGLNLPANYEERLRQRVEAMLARGWLAEIEGLWRDFGPDLPLLRTLGYAEMVRHWRGEWSREAAIAATVQRTRQLAKQQQTWFRHPANGGNAPWLDRETAIVQICEICQKSQRGNV